jgi:hypothetical protein
MLLDLVVVQTAWDAIEHGWAIEEDDGADDENASHLGGITVISLLPPDRPSRGVRVEEGTDDPPDLHHHRIVQASPLVHMPFKYAPYIRLELFHGPSPPPRKTTCEMSYPWLSGYRLALQHCAKHQSARR